jgi:hypothetical protein
VRYFRLPPVEDPLMVRVSVKGDEENLRVDEVFRRGPVGSWEPPTLETYRGGSAARPQDRDLFDRSFQLMQGLWPLFDEQLSELLRPLLVSPQDGEYLPARLGDRELTLYHCWRVVQAYDDLQSEYHTIPGIIGPKLFTRPVLAASKLGENPNFFSLTPYMGPYIVNELVHDIMISVGRLAQDLVEVEVLDR